MLRDEKNTAARSCTELINTVEQGIKEMVVERENLMRELGEERDLKAMWAAEAEKKDLAIKNFIARNTERIKEQLAMVGELEQPESPMEGSMERTEGAQGAQGAQGGGRKRRTKKRRTKKRRTKKRRTKKRTRRR